MRVAAAVAGAPLFLLETSRQNVVCSNADARQMISIRSARHKQSATSSAAFAKHFHTHNIIIEFVSTLAYHQSQVVDHMLHVSELFTQSFALLTRPNSERIRKTI